VLQYTEPTTAAATRDAFDAGLDVVFQSAYPQYRGYLQPFRLGMIADAVRDSAVARVLRAKFALGLFDDPWANPDSAAYWNGNPAHVALARQAARESIVLLRNERDMLPLSPTVHAIAVIGPDAVEARTGGYSARSNRRVSILDAIRARAGRGAAVRYAAGPGRASAEYRAVPTLYLRPTTGDPAQHGLRAEYYDNIELAGAPREQRVDSILDFNWTFNAPARGLEPGWYSVRWSGFVVAPATGVQQLGVQGNDGYRLYVDDTLRVDDWMQRSYGVRTVVVNFAPGSVHAVRLEYVQSVGAGHVRLVWDTGAASDWHAQVDSAVAIARASQAAVVVAGIEEGEFRDRARLALPGQQEALIRAVAATGTPVVVVLVGGSAITMSPWLDRVRAVVDAWYPGEQGGAAIADVLFGDVDPAGRLPITFPMAEGQLPLVYDHQPTGRGDDYVDLTGQPLFPFGFGLSYTRFRYDSLRIDPGDVDATGAATVRCVVTNVGSREGDEVVQLYLHQAFASVARPVIQLGGFQRVHLRPGESRAVPFPVSREQLQLYGRDGTWIVEPGRYDIMVGASSRDIRLRGTLLVH
jgi:beta-glucosidase